MIPTFILAAALSASAVNPPSEVQACQQTQFGDCHRVRGRYAIYVENDFLWIVGTKHMIEATDDKLDQMLEDAGWQDHVVFGDFVICPTSSYEKGRLQLACIQSYDHIRIAKRKEHD